VQIAGVHMPGLGYFISLHYQMLDHFSVDTHCIVFKFVLYQMIYLDLYQADATIDTDMPHACSSEWNFFVMHCILHYFHPVKMAGCKG
jgi:hypothetical protein